MQLIFPAPEHEEGWRTFLEAFSARQERLVPGSMQQGDGTYASFLQETLDYHQGKNIAATWVPASTYFLLDDAGALVGAVNIRHQLNNSLLHIGGHIGYGVLPTQRRKGYATHMLRLALEKCSEMGMDRALVTCDKTNIASAKTIQRCGGVLENEYKEENGNLVQRYWIAITSVK